MYKLYDFTCLDCGHTEEVLTQDPRELLPCPECSGSMQRIISGMHFKLDGTDPGFPGAYAAWERKRAQKLRQERSREASTGSPRPDVSEL